MKLRVHIVTVLEVPDVFTNKEIRDLVARAEKDGDAKDELDEIVGDIEHRFGWEESTITKVEEVK